jgi:SPP1 family predicted phage head-tail adaptor
VNSGKLRDVVVLQVVSETVDALGQPIQSWANVGTYRAHVRDLQGRESVIARQVKPSLTHAVETRRLPVTVSPVTHRFLHEGRVLNVDSSIDVRGDKSNYIHYCQSTPA